MAAVLLVEANIRTVVEAAVGCAAGQVGNHIQKVRGYQVIVAKGCGKATYIQHVISLNKSYIDVKGQFGTTDIIKP